MKAERHAYWATLIPTLERRTRNRSNVIEESAGFLVALATEMNTRPELAPFMPVVSCGSIRILHPDSRATMFYCLAPGPHSFKINALWPKSETYGGCGWERETIFEGDATSSADFLVRLVANVEVKSAGDVPPNSGQTTE